MTRDDITRLWADTFDDTIVLTTDGNEERLRHLIETLPFDSGLLTIDRAHEGLIVTPATRKADRHIVVGKRHRKIVEDARRRGLKNVFVFEDDAEFVALRYRRRCGGC